MRSSPPSFRHVRAISGLSSVREKMDSSMRSNPPSFRPQKDISRLSQVREKGQQHEIKSTVLQTCEGHLRAILGKGENGYQHEIKPTVLQTLDTIIIIKEKNSLICFPPFGDAQIINASHRVRLPKKKSKSSIPLDIHDGTQFKNT